MINLDDEVIVFTKGEAKYEVKKPNNGQIKKYQASLLRAETPEDKEKVLLCLLVDLGLPEEVYNSLTPGQMKKVIAALYESEKN